jgi:hypothetical protein
LCRAHERDRYGVEHPSEERVRKAVCHESGMHGLEGGKGRKALPIPTKSISPLSTSFGLCFISWQCGQATSSWREAPCEFFCRHHQHSPRDMTLQLHLAQCLSSGYGQQGEREDLARRPFSLCSPGCLSFRPLPVALRQPVAPSRLWLHERHSQRCMGTHKMIVGAPPLKVGQKLWSLLRGGPASTCQRRSCVTDRQWSPFNRGGV